MTSNNLLSNYTYMKTGGPADEVITVRTHAEMIQTVSRCRLQQLPYIILGSGSNTLFTDQGFRGVVILNRMAEFTIDSAKSQLIADSGCQMNALVNQVIPLGLSGIEWYLGLPGTLGGAIYNNAHFKNHFFAEVINTVTLLDESNQVITLPVAQLEANYDTSRFQHTHEVILSAVLNLTPDTPAAVMTRGKKALTFRSTHQPLSFPSSGSFFKNPASGVSAGALIDQAGLKNTTIGGAMVSPIHANFLVNTGTATSGDIQALAKKVEAVVFDKFKVKLEKEVFVINEVGDKI